MSDGLRRLVVAAAAAFAVLSPVVGLAAGLAMFGDGSIFAYSVAARDAWAFHWHNISGRLFSYVALYLPADAAVALTGSARAGIAAYATLLFSAPAASLLATRALDSSPSRHVFVFAAASSVCLLPFCFGFPTEMAMAHAAFWPTLALALDPRGGPARALGLYGLFQALVLTHEGGIVFAGCIALASIVGRPLRGFLGFAVAMAVWAAVKAALPPDAYIAGVLGAAAYKFVDPANFADPAFLLAAAVVVGFAVLARPIGPIRAGVVVAAAATFYWFALDTALLAEQRYALRIVLLFGTPFFGAAATLLAVPVENVRRLPFGGHLVVLRDWLGTRDARKLSGMLALLLLVHAVETGKFVAGWADYKASIRALAVGPANDPELGNPRFVSAARVDPAAYRLAWNSTTPFLSVLLAPGFAPERLVVDPAAGYFWLSCETATRNAQAENPLPEGARELVRIHACMWR